MSSLRLSERVKYLEEVNRFTLEALEQASMFLDFNIYDRLSGDSDGDTTLLLSDTDKRIRQLIPFSRTLFSLVDEDDFDFDVAWRSEDCPGPLDSEMSRLIDEGYFSLAISQRKMHFIPSEHESYYVALHIIASSSRIRGMFFGLIHVDDLKNLPEVSLSLSTIVFLICASAMESLSLYSMVRDNNLFLEQEVKRRDTQLKAQAEKDKLTGLPNRDFILSVLDRCLDRPALREKGFAFLHININRFKEVNNNFGLDSGDRILQIVAERLAESKRSQDVFARISGDGFAFLLYSVSSFDDVVKAAWRFIGQIEEPIKIEGETIYLDATAGIVTYPDHGRTSEELVRRAELAMRTGKQKKKSVFVYDQDCEEDGYDNFFLLGDLKRAIDSGEMFLFYQPQLDLRKGHMIGGEALVRWKHPSYGMVSPGKFIPLAEKTGMIRDVTIRVVEEAIRQIGVWSNRGVDMKVSVNLSALDIQDDHFLSRIGSVLKKNPHNPESLTFEITESSIIEEPDTAMANMKGLSEQGYEIALDDFGTGYSSLSYLHRFPVDTIKIDTSFVMHMMRDKNNAKIVQTIVSLGSTLGKKIVAEGVEDKETLQELQKIGCEHAQGFYIGKPDHPEELERLLADGKRSVVDI